VHVRSDHRVMKVKNHPKVDDFKGAEGDNTNHGIEILVDGLRL